MMLQELQREKLELSQSLDITEVINQSDVSKFEAERNLLLTANGRHFDILKACLIKYYECDAQEFDDLVDSVEVFMSNYSEDKRCLTQLITSKDEMQEEIESLMYKLQVLATEREHLIQLYNSSDTAKMELRMKQIEEERNVLTSDFVIKFDSI